MKITRENLKDFFMLTVASIIMVIGIYYFKFPNNFSFGGVSGFSIVLGAAFGHTPGYFNMAINMVLLIVGFIFFGKSFGVKTTYVTLIVSLGPSILEIVSPMTKPLTTEPVLELMFAILLPAFSSAVFFNLGASSGGTDILAMIMKKYTKVDIGSALFLSDILIVVCACFVFDAQTALFSLTGLLAKSLFVDEIIESLNLVKYFTIICDNPEPIVSFIMNDLGKGATVYKATGAYAHNEKTIILTILKRSQAVELKNFIRKNQPSAFLAITNSSEIIGKGFRDFD